MKKYSWDGGQDRWWGGAVDVICGSCQRPIILRAHPGNWWHVVKLVAPLIDSGDAFDPHSERAQRVRKLCDQHGARAFVMTHGIASKFSGGLWVEEDGAVVAGFTPVAEMFNDQWTHPQPARDAWDRCVIGQPTIITHSCGREIRVELFDLVSQIEDAIGKGRRKLWMPTAAPTK